jgi:hypothetical protein
LSEDSSITKENSKNSPYCQAIDKILLVIDRLIDFVNFLNKNGTHFFSEEKTKLEGVFKHIKDFSEYATIQGICHINSSRQTLFRKWFWSLALCFMFGLGTYWSCLMYIGWQQQQVFYKNKN